MSFAGTLRHDVPENDYVDYGDGIRLVGSVTFGLTSFGSGTVIGDRWVLTAAHVIAGADQNSQITFSTDPDPNDLDDTPSSGIFGVDAFAIHQFYDDNLGPAGGFDLALLHLDAPVTQYTPYGRFAANPASNAELGRTGTPVGFGATGTGLTGYDALTGGFVRLAGDNVIDALASDPRVIDQFVARDVVDPNTNQPIHFTQAQIASQFMLSDFDAPNDPSSGVYQGVNIMGSATSLPLEISVAPGDSGGPVFFTENGNRVVAGINSFIYGLPVALGGDGTDNASYSDLQGYLRISMFNDWIDEVTGQTVPEPAGLLMVLMAPMLLGRRYRREADL
jgi:hypothetical protein